MARYIFVTGGVVSSLGKGLSSASLAYLLQSRGYKVRPRKLLSIKNRYIILTAPFLHLVLLDNRTVHLAVLGILGTPIGTIYPEGVAIPEFIEAVILGLWIGIAGIRVFRTGKF